MRRQNLATAAVAVGALAATTRFGSFLRARRSGNSRIAD
jgi:hypothetical protein